MSQSVVSQSSVVRPLRPVASVELVSSRQSVERSVPVASVSSVASVELASEWRSLGDVVGNVLRGVSPAQRAA